MSAYEIEPGTESYYERTDRQTAVQIISEMVEEWPYAGDEHNYCHVRPSLIRLIEIATEAGYTPDLWSDRRSTP